MGNIKGFTLGLSESSLSPEQGADAKRQLARLAGGKGLHLPGGVGDRGLTPQSARQ